jgi:hypothetical protein
MRKILYQNKETGIFLYTPEALNGLTGDNGEEFCVFFRDYQHPLASGWAWFPTEEKAKDFAKREWLNMNK